MASRKRRSPARLRVGKVSLYLHHGAWWLYSREHGKQVRRKVGEARDEAEQVAAQVKLIVQAKVRADVRLVTVNDENRDSLSEELERWVRDRLRSR